MEKGGMRGVGGMKGGGEGIGTNFGERNIFIPDAFCHLMDSRWIESSKNPDHPGGAHTAQHYYEKCFNDF